MSKIKLLISSLITMLTLSMPLMGFAQDQSNTASTSISTSGSDQGGSKLTPTLSPVEWTSMNSGDKITVENATESKLVLFVSVSTNNNPNAPGINIQNCGSTSHISAGSSVVCPLKGTVTFNSDGGRIAYGTYQIMKP